MLLNILTELTEIMHSSTSSFTYYDVIMSWFISQQSRILIIAGISPIATSSPPKETVAMEQVWVVDESRSPGDGKRLSRSTETNLNVLERPTHATTAHYLLRRHNSSREADRRRLHPNTYRRSGRGQYKSAENLPSANGTQDLAERSSSLHDVSIQVNPLGSTGTLTIPTIGIEEASDQDDDMAASHMDAQGCSSPPTPSLSLPPLSFMNPQLVQHLNCPHEGSASSLSTRTTSDSDVSLSGSMTPDINELRRNAEDKGEGKVRKSR